MTDWDIVCLTTAPRHSGTEENDDVEDAKHVPVPLASSLVRDPRGTEVKKKEWRRTPPIWVWVLILIPLALMVWMRVGDPIGDQGVTNVNSLLLVVLAGLIASIWFVFFSGHSRLRRYSYLLAVIVIVVAFFSLVRYEGVSGNMIPKLSFGLSDDAGPESVPEVDAPTAVPPGVAPIGTTKPSELSPAPPPASPPRARLPSAGASQGSRWWQ